MVNILEFDTEVKAQACNNAIRQVMANKRQDQGYTVIQTQDGPAVIGKNGNGVDVETALTLQWDEVKQSPANTYYIMDPSSMSDMADWQDRAAELSYVFDGTAKELPQEWMPQGD